MKQYKGVVFFDYDYTTMDAEAEIFSATSKTKESLKKLEKNGYLTMLCSGRSKRFLEADADIFQGVITCNGSYAEVHGKKIRDKHIQEEDVQEVIKRYRPEKVSIHLETQNVTYYTFQHKEMYDKFRDFLEFPDCWFAPLENRKGNEHITKIVIYYGEEAVYQDFQMRYSKQFQIVKPFEEEPIFDVTLKGITKGDAIRQVLDLYQIDRENSYAFGDSDNDIEMLKTVGTGVVMAKHSKGAAEAAAMMTGTVKEEGITQGLEKLGLI